MSTIEQIKQLPADDPNFKPNVYLWNVPTESPVATGIAQRKLKALAESHERMKGVMKAYMDAFIANDGHPDDTEMTRKMQAAIDEAEKLMEDR
jgi:hypothetical protein